MPGNSSACAATRSRGSPLITKQTAARRLGWSQPDLTRRGNQGYLISVRWQGARRFPDFQFDQERQRLRPYLGKILGQFTAAEREEGWPVFMWFATPRKSLNDEYPGEVLAVEPACVLEAIQGEFEPQDW